MSYTLLKFIENVKEIRNNTKYKKLICFISNIIVLHIKVSKDTKSKYQIGFRFLY